MRWTLLMLTAASALCVTALSMADKGTTTYTSNTVEGVEHLLRTMRDELPPCPVTRPNGDTPPGERPSPNHHGNGEIWTGLYPEGTVVFGPGWPGFIGADGELSMKFWWWHAEPDASLHIEGRRLDAPSPSMWAELPDGYDGTFQASGLSFPSPGCWEVTAQAGSANLTFVTRVILVPAELDAVALVELAGSVSAYVSADYPDAVLEAIDVTASKLTFRFATRLGDCAHQWCETTLQIPRIDAPEETWVLLRPTPSGPGRNYSIGIRFSPLQMFGAASAREALAAYEQGCHPETITLSAHDSAIVDGAAHPAWYAACPIPSGLSRTLRIDAQTGHVSPALDVPVGTCLVNHC